MRARLAVGLATLMIVAAACATPGATSTGDLPIADDSALPSDHAHDPDLVADGLLSVQSGAVADGPGISVEEALGWLGVDEAVLVNGALVVDADGTVLLCDALAESFPPQCAGARLAVDGLDPAGIADLQEGNGVRWADRVQIFGEVDPLPPTE